MSDRVLIYEKSNYLKANMLRAPRVISQGNGRIAKIFCFIVQAIGLSLTTSQEKHSYCPGYNLSMAKS